MTKQPAYFDSQASAAAALKIDIYKLRDAKREGCPAFRSGRVYADDLLTWFENKRLRRKQAADSNRDETKERLRLAASAMIALAECANANLIGDDQFFQCGKMIVEAAGDQEFRDIFTNMIYGRLLGTYSELPEAFTAQPEITYWIIRERLMTPKERAELPTELPPSPGKRSQRAKLPKGS
jgi:hypothetical protein